MFITVYEGPVGRARPIVQNLPVQADLAVAIATALADVRRGMPPARARDVWVAVRDMPFED